LGSSALERNKSGSRNIAIGYKSQYVNSVILTSEGNDNISLGHESMSNLSTASRNTSIGNNAQLLNESGSDNVAVGFGAAYANKSGFRNTGVGIGALEDNVSGNYNVAIGAYANVGNDNLEYATAIGAGAVVNSSNSILLGSTLYDIKVGMGNDAPTSKLDVIGIYNTTPLVKLTQFGTNAPALKIAASSGNGGGVELENASIRVTGSNKFAFQHVCTLANQSGANGTIITNIGFANQATDLLYITPVFEPGGVFANFVAHAFWDAGTNRWLILNPNGFPVPVGAKFNIMVIKQ
ncbi:MAG TPA: hypothetical protein PLY70_13415, partial [Saprospiraceae bacterium]|nr:hypothetical protein [Saprospiraceae bacterium]